MALVVMMELWMLVLVVQSVPTVMASNPVAGARALPGTTPLMAIGWADGASARMTADRKSAAELAGRRPAMAETPIGARLIRVRTSATGLTVATAGTPAARSAHGCMLLKIFTVATTFLVPAVITVMTSVRTTCLGSVHANSKADYRLLVEDHHRYHHPPALAIIVLR
ncbi:MAG TPA: hypothetical protein VF163_05510 [Micromonosporaceae bacterium]